MLLLAAAHFVVANAVQGGICPQSQRIESSGMQVIHILLDILQGNAADPADGVRKVFVNDAAVDTNGLKNLGTLVGLDGGNTHLGCDLDNAVQNGVVIIIHSSVVILVQCPVLDHVADALLGQIRVDGTGAIAQQRCEMVHIPGLAALQNDGHGGTLLGDDQMLMYRSHCQQGRNGLMVLIHTPVCQDQDIGPVSVGTVDLHVQAIQCPLQVGVIIIGNGDLGHLEALYLHIFDFQNVRVGQDRVVHLQHLTVFRPLLQQVAVLPDVNGGGSDDLLTNGINGRVGYLSKQLFEIVEQRLMLLG